MRAVATFTRESPMHEHILHQRGTIAIAGPSAVTKRNHLPDAMSQLSFRPCGLSHFFEQTGAGAIRILVRDCDEVVVKVGFEVRGELRERAASENNVLSLGDENIFRTRINCKGATHQRLLQPDQQQATSEL